MPSASRSVRSSLPTWLMLLAVITGFGLLYGAVMGAFEVRPQQMLYSAAKVPFLLFTAFALSLPSYFVIGSLLGLRADLLESSRRLLGAQAASTVVLASLAPFIAFLYASNLGYDASKIANGVMFGVAAICGQVVLRRLFADLIANDRRHLYLLRGWLVMYAFIGVQMAWVLRPFVGNPAMTPTFFRQGAWGNAYEELARAFMNAMGA